MPRVFQFVHYVLLNVMITWTSCYDLSASHLKTFNYQDVT